MIFPGIHGRLKIPAPGPGYQQFSQSFFFPNGIARFSGDDSRFSSPSYRNHYIPRVYY
jgi:hypothetical protein